MVIVLTVTGLKPGLEWNVHGDHDDDDDDDDGVVGVKDEYIVYSNQSVGGGGGQIDDSDNVDVDIQERQGGKN